MKQKYLSIAPAKKDRRFFASLIDILMTILLGIGLFELCFFPLFNKSEKYINLENKAYSLRLEMTDIYKESRLKLFNELNEPLDNVNLYVEFIDDIKNKNESCLEHFYLTYLKEHDEQYYSKDIRWFNKEILNLPQKDEDLNYSYYFDYQLDEFGNRMYDSIGVFNNSNGFLDNLNYFLDGKIFESSTEAYSSLRNWFNNKLSEATNILVNEPYYSVKYNEYLSYQKEMSLYVSYASLLSFVTSSLIFYILIPCFTKRRQTIGEIICKIKCIKLNGEEMSIIQTIGKNIIRLLSVFSLYCLMPIFKINIVLCLTLPIFQIGSLSINMVILHLICGIFLIADLFVSIYQSSNRSIPQLITKTKPLSLKKKDYRIID